MNTKTALVNDIKKAEQAFNTQLGKHEYSEAFDLLIETDLSAEAELIVLNIIDEAFEKDASVGYLRYDGIVGRLQVTAIRLSR